MWAIFIAFGLGTFQLGGFESSAACLARLDKEVQRFERTGQKVTAFGCEYYEPKK